MRSGDTYVIPPTHPSLPRQWRELGQREQCDRALPAIPNRRFFLRLQLVEGGSQKIGNRGSVELAAKNQLPAMYQAREFVDAGGLMSYGANLTDLNRRAATYVDKILRGTKPADLPVEQPTTFELLVNLKTAKQLGLTISREFLLIADEVIE